MLSKSKQEESWRKQDHRSGVSVAAGVCCSNFLLSAQPGNPDENFTVAKKRIMDHSIIEHASYNVEENEMHAPDWTSDSALSYISTFNTIMLESFCLCNVLSTSTRYLSTDSDQHRCYDYRFALYYKQETKSRSMLHRLFGRMSSWNRLPQTSLSPTSPPSMHHSTKNRITMSTIRPQQQVSSNGQLLNPTRYLSIYSWSNCGITLCIPRIQFCCS